MLGTKGFSTLALTLSLGAQGPIASPFRDFRELDLQAAFESVVSEAKSSIHLAKQTVDEILDDDLFANEPNVAEDDHDPDQTIYQIIKANEHTTKFAKLVDKHDALVKALNSTKTNATLFVPVDAAFEHIPDDQKKPPKEFIEALIKYHVVSDKYRAQDLIGVHTLPTLFHEKWLGGEPQRLRVRLGLTGVRLNFYSKVVGANEFATNGVVHFINHILVPPPMVGRELSLFPSAFSTLLHAYDKTDFVDFIHKVEMNGSTVFAPSNSAFEKLGPAANAFLFNSPKGLKCLKALLKYQIVANTTLYSDAVYDGAEGDASSEETEHSHYELTTLLDEKSLGVDITKWHGLITFMRVNGDIGVKVQDGIAKNGVIHVVEKVPIPPHKHQKGDSVEQEEGNMSAEELEVRLTPYIEEEDVEAGIGEL